MTAGVSGDECAHGISFDTCSYCLAKARVRDRTNVTKSAVAVPDFSIFCRCMFCGTYFYSTGDAECLDCMQRRATRRQQREQRRSELRANPPVWTPWKLQFDLRQWQSDALHEWQTASNRGVIEAATGTGKTAVALAAIAELHREHAGAFRVAIVVPTKVLAHQWREQLERNLSLLPTWIGEHHSAATTEWSPRHPILIAVVNSARTRLAPVLEHWSQDRRAALLIVDECHRAGSEYNSRIFDGTYAYALGLSATPERDDGGHEQHVYPGLGRPIYRYPLLTALDDGVLAPVVSVNLYVDFDAAEQQRWTDLTDDLANAFRQLKYAYPELEYVPDDRLLREIARLAEQEEPLALKIQGLISSRRELLSTARARLACQEAILLWLANSRRRALVFHETIAAARASHAFLTAQGVNAGLDHSQLRQDARSSAMDRFRNDRDQILVAVRALDEGVDVPDASVAVIAAGSRSRRQRIQRIGRVLRRADDKQALLVTILVRGTPEEEAVGGRDAALLGAHRVRHHRWPGIPVDRAVIEEASTFQPAQRAYAIADLLTLLDLGLWTPELHIDRTAPILPSLVGDAAGGGYAAREATFSPNAWYSVDDIRDGIGMPQDDFDRLRREVRRAYRLSLDPQKADNLALIHGSEIDAVRRQWHQRQHRR